MSKILIVADDDSVRKGLKERIEAMGHETKEATCLNTAIKWLDKNTVDCVLLDLSMPELDGEATLRELRKSSPSARVLLMSGYEESEALRQFAGLDLDGFLQKPFTPEALLGGLAAVFVA